LLPAPDQAVVLADQKLVRLRLWLITGLPQRRSAGIDVLSPKGANCMLALHPDLGVAIGMTPTTTPAAVGATGAVLEHLTVPGYRQLIGFGRRHGATLWAIEGTGSFGAGLTTALHACCERVVEVGRPQRPARRGGVKSDDIDAVRAARQVLAGVGLSPSVGCVHLTKEIPMATDLAAEAGTQPTTRSEARPLGQLLRGPPACCTPGSSSRAGLPPRCIAASPRCPTTGSASRSPDRSPQQHR
jgi:hypothetical protein